uniref:Poly [ADP-ribose] polymerase n=1 Tax=Crassostrea virginica TaxID=6565 RepID=A0A8B8BUY0_CRAVI|nr:uncharacterized protein LOC111113046 [Crassostrea virginica]
MASPAKKTKTSALPTCPYGARCYRKNPEHFKEFLHPPKASTSTDKTSKGADSKTPDAKSKTSAVDDTSLPPCKYGASCYRKNLLHFAEFSHPTAVVRKASQDSGSDTDPIESDDDKKKKSAVKTEDVLKRGMSLVKKYSQMTEEQRKELIKQAFEAKQKLQEELKETQDKVKEKEKELEKMQHQVSSGQLLVEGEKEALEGKDTVYFTLTAERNHKEGSAEQTHFRLAESQFYRLLSGTNNCYTIKKVEYVVNPDLMAKFKQSKEDLKKERGEELSYPVLAFHGTEVKNISKICDTGFRVPGQAGFKHTTDTGWYGKGVYFSEYPEYSMDYIDGAEKLLLCQVLPGKVFHCKKLIHGAALSKGHDSHTSPDKKELVIFNSHHILPCYVVHYKLSSGEFKYAKTTPGVRKTTRKAKKSGDEEDDEDGDNDDDEDDDDVDEMSIMEKCRKAEAASKSKVMSGQRILFTGSFCLVQKEIANLVVKHGATVGTLGNFNLCVSTPLFVDNASTKFKKAEEKNIPIVSEEFLYDSIINKKLQNPDDYYPQV